MEKTDHPSRADTANYILDMAAELKALAEDHHADQLTFLLSMVVHEASAISKSLENHEAGPKRSGSPDTKRLYRADIMDDTDA